MDDISNMNTTEEINIALKAYLEAFHEKKWDALSAMLDDGFTYFTDKCHKLNKSEFISFMSNNPWNGIDYSIKNVRVISAGAGDIGIARYDTEFNGIFNNKPAKVEAVETTVFKKIDDNWQLVHSHTSNK